LSANPQDGYAFIVLLRDGDDANGLARLLEDVRLPQANVSSVFAAPPVRGVDFFSDEARQPEIDAWWGENVSGAARPVYLLAHEDGLAEWTKGVDGTFYIGLPSAGAGAAYEDGGEQIQTFVFAGPLDFATVIMRDFSGGNGSGALIFDEGEALRMAALSSDFPLDLGESFEPIPAPSAAGAPAGYGNAGAYGDPFSAAGGGSAGVGVPGTPADPFGRAPAERPAPRPPRAAPAASTPHPFDLLSGPGQGGGAAPAPAADPAGYPSSDHEPIPVPGGWEQGGGGGAAWDQGGAGGGGGASWEQGGSGGGGSWEQGGGGGAGNPQSWGQDAWNQGGGQAWSPGQGGSWQEAPQGAGRRGGGGGGKLSLPSFGGLGGLFKGGAPKSNFQPSSDHDLAQMLVRRGPTIVVMGSRKGGVGKTSYAAGVAIVGGTVLDQVGHKACIVDANIANPDAWGQMNLREGAATVREVVAALTANREPPPPVHATTPALACYPESREATEYSKTDIRRFAEYLRRRYTFIVVDMSNRLPDPMAGPEAAAAAYWLEHGDVLVLPTTSAKADFNGVLDYLDVRDLPPTVVPYIIPAAKRNREHPVTQQYLNVIRERVQRIVEVPDEADKVRLAGMEGIPVEQVSPRLRLAYRELTEVVARTPPRAR
jgi:MinD-like ATPase involved in chromosome partitioning or flagellar assembly